jgi:hypothetical protein
MNVAERMYKQTPGTAAGERVDLDGIRAEIK